MRTPWPRWGPHFNVWLRDAARFLRIVQDHPQIWLEDGRLKYLQLNVDTRSGNFTLRDRDGKSIEPEAVTDAVELVTASGRPRPCGRPYTGLCVGGPMAGQTLAHHSPWYRCAEFEPLPTEVDFDVVASTELSEGTLHLYEHDADWLVTADGERVAIWRHEGLKDGSAAFRHVVEEYDRLTRKEKTDDGRR